MARRNVYAFSIAEAVWHMTNLSSENGGQAHLNRRLVRAAASLSENYARDSWSDDNARNSSLPSIKAAEVA